MSGVQRPPPLPTAPIRTAPAPLASRCFRQPPRLRGPRRQRNTDRQTLEELLPQSPAGRDELRAFEQRLGVLLQEMDDKEVIVPTCG